MKKISGREAEREVEYYKYNKFYLFLQYEESMLTTMAM